MSDLEMQILWRTLEVAAFSTACIMPPAILLGWILARKEFIGKTLFESILNLPMVVPPVVTGYLLLMVLGRKGFVGAFLLKYLNLSLTCNYTALVIAAGTVSLPLAIRSSRAGIELVDRKLEDASLSLGIPPWLTFFRITLPIASPAIFAGAVLAFARALGEFGATITFAGNIPGKTQTIALGIYSSLQTPDSGQTSMRLITYSVCISFLALAVSEYFQRRMKRRL